MRKIGYVLLLVSLIMVCVGAYGWMLHLVTVMGIVMAMAGTKQRHEGE